MILNIQCLENNVLFWVAVSRSCVVNALDLPASTGKVLVFPDKKII